MKNKNLKKKVKKAMTYPISVLVVALIVTAILLLKVVPQFENMFAGFGAELPAFTHAGQVAILRTVQLGLSFGADLISADDLGHLRAGVHEIGT